MIASQLTLIPVTIVFFILIGRILIDNNPSLENYTSIIFMVAILLALIVSAVEFMVILRKVNIENYLSKPEEERIERQRKMILEVFGDTLDGKENEK